MAYDFQSLRTGNWSDPTVWHNSHTITGVVTGTKTFTVAGDVSAEIIAGSLITVIGGANAGSYTVVSSIHTTSTAIVVSQVIPSAVVAGAILSATLPQATGYSGDCYVDHNLTVDVQIASADSSAALIVRLGDTNAGLTLQGAGNLSSLDYFIKVLQVRFYDSCTVQDSYMSCQIAFTTAKTGNFVGALNRVTMHGATTPLDDQVQINAGTCVLAMTDCTVDLGVSGIYISADGEFRAVNQLTFLTCSQLGFDGTDGYQNGPYFSGNVLFTGQDLVMNLFVTNLPNGSKANLGSLDGSGTWTFRDCQDQSIATDVELNINGTFLFENTCFFKGAPVDNTSGILVFVPTKPGSVEANYGGYQDLQVSKYIQTFYGGSAGGASGGSNSMRIGL